MGAYNTIAGIYLFFLLQCVQCLFSRTHLSAYFIKRRESASTRVVAYPNLEVVQAAQDSKVINTNSVINVNPEYQNFYWSQIQYEYMIAMYTSIDETTIK